LFRGVFFRDLETSEFVDAQDKNVLHEKYLILQSIRMAFHYAVEMFVMGEMEIGNDKEEFLVKFYALIVFRKRLIR